MSCYRAREGVAKDPVRLNIGDRARFLLPLRSIAVINGAAHSCTGPRSGGADGKLGRYQRPLRGRGWHTGQVCEERFMNCSRLITPARPASAHRLHGWPVRP